jgi:hypothetical protein
LRNDIIGMSAWQFNPLCLIHYGRNRNLEN